MNKDNILHDILSADLNVPGKTEYSVSGKAMTVSTWEESSKIGTEIMKKGGNAFDAMIAAELTLALACPFADNIAGGGFMVYRKANGETGTLDYCKKAPAVSNSIYIDRNGKLVKKKETNTKAAIEIPGTIAGIFAVHKKFGSLPISIILKPVIDLAKEKNNTKSQQKTPSNSCHNSTAEQNPENLLFSAGQHNETGGTKYPALTETLKRIQKNGCDEFYKGRTAKTLINYLKKKGEKITLKDLSEYEPVWGKPETHYYKNLKITLMSELDNDEICLTQILKIIESLDLEETKTYPSETAQITAKDKNETNKFFTNNFENSINCLKELHNEENLNQKDVKFNFTSPDLFFFPTTKNTLYSNPSQETAAYSIIDQFGNAIAAATTLNTSDHSKYYCNELGFFFNNEMKKFTSFSKTQSALELTKIPVNHISQQAALNASACAIIEKNNSLFMIISAPNGPAILVSAS